MPAEQHFEFSADKVGFFISYNKADRKIASELSVCLTNLSEDLSVFIDHIGIAHGDDIEEELAQAIRHAHWFIMIYSGPYQPEKDMGWCLFEAGQFRQKLDITEQDDIAKSRIVVLYDDELPRQLRRFKHVKVATGLLPAPPEPDNRAEDIRLERSDLFEFFSDVVNLSRDTPLRNLADQSVRSILRDNVKRLEQAFENAKVDIRLAERPLFPRISYQLPPTVGRKAITLEDATVLSGFENSLATLFGIAASETTWGDLKAICVERNGATPLWMQELERATSQVSLDLLPETTDTRCFLREKLYSVSLARYEIFRSRARICHVSFLPIGERNFDLRQRTSILLSSLILSIRFRERLIPIGSEMKAASRARRKELCLKFQRELYAAEFELRHFGIAATDEEYDDAPLLNAFREGKDKQFVRQEIAAWTKARNEIVNQITRALAPQKANDDDDAFEVAINMGVNELERLKPVNGLFITAITEELLHAESISRDV